MAIRLEKGQRINLEKELVLNSPIFVWVATGGAIVLEKSGLPWVLGQGKRNFDVDG